MQQIGKISTEGHNAPTRSVTLSTPLSSPSTEALQSAKATALRSRRMLETFPDFNKVTPPIMAGVIEKLASLSPDMLERVCSITEGLPSRCKYFPTVYDINELVKEFEARYVRVSKPPSPYGPYAYFKPDPRVEPTPEASERAKKLVEEFHAQVDALHKPLKANSDENAEWRKPGPPSKQLIAWLKAQDWPHLSPELDA